MIQEIQDKPGQQRGLAICVSGPSGVGKGTIIRSVLARRPSIRHSVSITTRRPRPGEKNGIDYYFVDHPTFERMIADDEILEHDCYCDQYYGTPRKPLAEAIGSGLDVILDITVPGSLSIMQKIPECVTIFLLPPSFSELENRLLKRGTETDDIVRKRLEKARHEVTMADRFQYLVVNDDLAETAQRILAIIDAEHCRYPYQAGIEQVVLAR
ncbi:MAG: guanylate kinase [Clostridiaceae bacterium]|nr:guanylate kinase [Eubacteriales bacterium]NLV48502.1 guanylate kinase [Clostridiaceae bacterium]